MPRSKANSEARKRILDTTRRLFYHQGYRATGINEIIKKSGVAKATFYAHFPSKEKLAYTYIQAQNEEETRLLEQELTWYPAPYDKLVGLMEFLIHWSKERDYRGCTYLNISSEIPDPSNPLRRESQSHYDAVRRLVGQLVHQLKEQRGAAWKNRDAEAVADDFLLIFAGALSLGQIYHQAKPFQAAIEGVKRLLA